MDNLSFFQRVLIVPINFYFLKFYLFLIYSLLHICLYFVLFVYLFTRAFKRVDASEQISVRLPVSDIYLLWYSEEISCFPAS
jgi:hypothetical protein